MEDRRGRSRRGADLSNLAFRPRPIDVNRPIPIIRHEIEDEESTGVSRSVPKMPTGMEHEDEEEIHIQNAIAASLVPSAETTVIPTPSVRLIESYFTTKHPESWTRPQAYVKYKERTLDELDQSVEYDLDDEDDQWLKRLNQEKKVLSSDKFELMVDRLEKTVEHIPEGENMTLLRAEKLLAAERIEIRSAIVSAVYNYWSQKRKNFKAALVRRLQKPPAPDDPSPLVAFRPRTNEKAIRQRKLRKNDPQSHLKLKQLRQEFERARTLLEMIKKRERIKQDIILYSKSLFEAQVENMKKRARKRGWVDDDDNACLAVDFNEELPPAPEESTSFWCQITNLPRSSFSSLSSSSSAPSSTSFAPSSPSPSPSPFFGRARIGRGGRVLFDRGWAPPKAFGPTPLSLPLPLAFPTSSSSSILPVPPPPDPPLLGTPAQTPLLTPALSTVVG